MNSRVVTAFVLNSCVSVKSAWKGQRSNSSCFQISPALCRRNLLLLQDNHCKVWLTVVIFFLVSIKKCSTGQQSFLCFVETADSFFICFMFFCVQGEIRKFCEQAQKNENDGWSHSASVLFSELLLLLITAASLYSCINVLGLLKNIQSHLDLIGRQEH